jgi:hypothetical protein
VKNTIRGVVVYFQSQTITGTPLAPPPFPGFTWDAETDISESYQVQSSDHPIQAGAADVTDNIHTLPAIISVSGIVTNFPILRQVKLGGVNVDGSSFSSDLAVALKQLILGYQKARRRVVVATSRGTFSPCIIGNIDVKWGPTDGGSLNISAQFKQIRIARQVLIPSIQDADLLASGATSGGTSTSSSTNIGSWGAGQ